MHAYKSSKRTELSNSFSQTAKQTPTASYPGKDMSETLSKAQINLNFNNNAEVFSQSQGQQAVFNHTTRNQVELSAEKSATLSANQKNWEDNIRSKLAASSFPEPTNDLDAIRNRDINAEYQTLLKSHQVHQKHIEMQYAGKIQSTRNSGSTLTEHFSDKTPSPKGNTYQRPIINQQRTDRIRDR